MTTAKVIQTVSPLSYQEKHKCSFCGVERECAKATVSGAAICALCLQNTQEMCATVLPGSVNCLKCKKHDVILVNYQNGAGVAYKAELLDLNGFVAYSVVEFEGAWKSGVERSSAMCGACGADIPLYLLSRTEYIL